MLADFRRAPGVGFCALFYVFYLAAGPTLSHAFTNKHLISSFFIAAAGTRAGP